MLPDITKLASIVLQFLMIVFLLSSGVTTQSVPRLVSSYPAGAIQVREHFNDTILTFRVKDYDHGDNITIGYGDIITKNTVIFTRSEPQSNDVNVTVKPKIQLDRDAPGSSPITLKFTATDKRLNQLLIEKDLYIDDINDNAPQFNNGQYRLELKERHFNGSPIVVYTSIHATDVDSGVNSVVVYSLEPVAQSEEIKEAYCRTFSIDVASGNIALNQPLDYETNTYYQFTVIAKDKGKHPLNSTADLIIRVLDEQDTPPFFTGVPQRIVINENIQNGSSVVNVTARDGDSGLSNSVNYTILNGSACGSLFKINTTNGTITTAKPIDRDDGVVSDNSGVCTLTIMAQEIDMANTTQYGNTTTTTNVTITVVDVNDNYPEFDNTTYNAEVHENTAVNVPITFTGGQDTINVKDLDQRTNSIMDISLKYPNGTNCGDFSPSPSQVQGAGSVMIRVKNKTLLDFEQIQNITFLVIATETANTSHVATATVSLALLDMNDNNPQFANRSYSFTVDENSENGTSVGRIEATDKDSGVRGNLSYSISGGNNRFVVHEYSGIISVSCNNCPKDLDRETRDEYQMTYTATDGEGRSNSTSLAILLNDVNDNTPQFSRPVYTAFFKENEDQHKINPLVTVEATDSDQANTPNSNITYSIIDRSDYRMNFSLDETNGTLYLDTPIDYELLQNTSGLINLTINAEDQGTSPRDSNCTIQLTVQDVNDNIPIFSNTRYNASIPEDARSNSTNLTYVGQVVANDSDGTAVNNKFNYFITAGANDQFAINASTGDVYVQLNAKLDRESLASYNITLLAIDRGAPPMTGSASIIVTVTDVNDAPPGFNQTSYSAMVLENQTKGSEVITCYATDEDENNNLFYSIIHIEALDEDGNPVNDILVSTYFNIHNTTGTVSVDGQLDREVAETIKLTLLVEDKNAFNPKPQNATTTLTLTLEDINDNDPVFVSNDFTVNVSENALNQTILGTFHATDKDKNTLISYSISPKNAFQINSNSGVLKKTGPIDRETQDTICLNITATDNGVPQLSSTIIVTVNVLDYNDNNPKFQNTAAERVIKLPENASKETVAITMRANDSDIGPNADITFSIRGDKGHFIINNKTGVITVSNTLDRETISSYELTVIAVDNPSEASEAKSAQAVVKIQITDVNDKSPIFNPTTYTRSVLENADVGTSIVTITATDDDEESTDNSNLTYTIQNPTDKFAINKYTGDITVNSSLKSYVGSYVIKITAEDHGDPKLNGTAEVNITVTDVNLNNPVIVNLPTNNTIKIYECARIGTIVHTFNYTDLDHGKNAEAVFNISNLPDGYNVLETFKLYPNGTLITKQELNINDREFYKFQVQVTDKGVPTRSSNTPTLTVQVLDVDNHLPSFAQPSKNMEVHENRPKWEPVGTVTADDEDQDSIACYSITTENSSFTIGENTGSIATTYILDYDNTTTYSLTVQVKDCSIKSNYSEDCDNQTHKNNATTEITVHVTVIDENDNPPVFMMKEIIIGMKRVTEVGESLNIQLKSSEYVKDRDTDPNGILSWKFENNGTIKTSQGLDVNVNDGTVDCEDGIKHVFCVTGNGSIINNKFFSEDVSGYFYVPVKVSDIAGSDTARVKIYLIGDSEILIMTVLGKKEDVSKTKDYILELYSNITGHLFVYDGIEDHKTSDGRIDTYKTDIYFHVVERNSQKILSAEESLRLVDKFYNALQVAASSSSVVQIVSSIKAVPPEDASTETIFILIAINVVLVLTVALIIYISFTIRNKYKRKLKAATVRTTEKDTVIREATTGSVPGSNQYSKMSNPLLNADIRNMNTDYDTISMNSHNSLDTNEVGEIRHDTVYDTMEEREATMDMFTEDEFVASKQESPLDAALKMHEAQKAADMDTEDSLNNGSVGHGFMNHAFDNDGLESSEI